ncbi:MAG: hypothetical protein J3R72DRAFT_491732 [Linnemannia gamsii]|nr:MAG: hypothetical protein J3R72DRAFT_491732 [Linnemannia gamsii]
MHQLLYKRRKCSGSRLVISTVISATAIFSECLNLDVLYNAPYDHPGPYGHTEPWDYPGQYVTLDNVFEYPWRCTGLTELRLGISGCEVPPVDPGVQPQINWIGSKYTPPFPAKLNLPDTTTGGGGRPEYLDHLSGLKQLKWLGGSVNAGAGEDQGDDGVGRSKAD